MKNTNSVWVIQVNGGQSGHKVRCMEQRDHIMEGSVVRLRNMTVCKQGKDHSGICVAYECVGTSLGQKDQLGGYCRSPIRDDASQ